MFLSKDSQDIIKRWKSPADCVHRGQVGLALALYGTKTLWILQHWPRRTRPKCNRDSLYRLHKSTDNILLVNADLNSFLQRRNHMWPWWRKSATFCSVCSWILNSLHLHPEHHLSFSGKEPSKTKEGRTRMQKGANVTFLTCRFWSCFQKSSCSEAGQWSNINNFHFK